MFKTGNIGLRLATKVTKTNVLVFCVAWMNRSLGGLSENRVKRNGLTDFRHGFYPGTGVGNREGKSASCLTGGSILLSTMSSQNPFMALISCWVSPVPFNKILCLFFLRFFRFCNLFTGTGFKHIHCQWNHHWVGSHRDWWWDSPNCQHRRNSVHL